MLNKLSKDMTETQFDNGYWYATELKAFAKSLGIPGAAKLRKDQLEREIRHYLRRGAIRQVRRTPKARSGSADHEKGLSLDLPVVPVRDKDRGQNSQPGWLTVAFGGPRYRVKESDSH